jgi:hypothetical protein
MKIELVVQVTLKVPLAKRSQNAPPKHAKSSHRDSPAGFKNLPITPAMRSQFSASDASCFLPARVMA